MELAYIVTGAAPRRAIAVAPKGRWPAGEAIDSVTLDHAGRHRRRVRLTTDSGGAVLLDLKETAMLADGDGLRLEGGGWLRVRAATEALIEIATADADLLARVAWHLGNRHVPAELAPGRIRIQDDHVLADMLARLGAPMRRLTGTFSPEPGAYAGHAHRDPGDE